MRQATEDDLPALEVMARRFHEKKQDRYPYHSSRGFLTAMISSGVIFIAEDGFLAGCIAGEASNPDYLVAHEVLWWSEGRSGLKMRRAFEQWAKEKGCSEVQFSHPANEETVGRMLRRAGYSPATQVWRKPCA